MTASTSHQTDSRAACAASRPRRQRTLAGVLAAAIAVGLAMTGAGCSLNIEHHHAATGQVGLSVSNSGKATTFDVDPSKPFDLKIPGVATINGPAGSVSSSGRITVQPLEGDTSGQAGLSVAGKGIDVTFQDTRLLHKVTVTFTDDPNPPQDPTVTSAVLHRNDDGTTDLIAAKHVAGGLRFRTKHFSPNIPINIDLDSWFKDRLDSLADYVTGRTDPEDCANNAPSWARFTSNSDLIHECAINNPDSNGVDRAEAQFTTNRRYWLTAQAPAGAAYVWVKDQPDLLRKILAGLDGADPSRYVFLQGTEGMMTAGFYRPSGTDKNVTFSFQPDVLTQLLSLTEAMLSRFEVGGRGLLSASVLLVAKCKEEVPGLLGSIQGKVFDFLACVAEQAGDQLADGSKAFASAMNLFGDAGYAKDTETALATAKTGMQVLGWLLKAMGFASALRNEVSTVVDNFLGIVNPRTQEATFTLSGTRPSPPSTPAPAQPSQTATQRATQAPAPTNTPPPSQAVGTGSGGSASEGNPPFTGGYTIDDSVYGGTWPRTDPNDGTWYDSAHRPPNAADYWWRDGLGVGFSCGITNGAPYTVKFTNGQPAQTWTTWIRSTDTWGGRVTGLWVPSAVADNIFVDGLPPGMPSC